MRIKSIGNRQKKVNIRYLFPAFPSLFFLVAIVALSSGAWGQFIRAGSNQADLNGRLQVRLIQVDETARNTAERDRRLQDILPLLERNLRYNSYRLVSQNIIRVQPGVRTGIGAGFMVIIEDVQGPITSIGLYYTQTGHRRENGVTAELLRTRLRLQRNRPVVIGPFRDHNRNQYIIVFTL